MSMTITDITDDIHIEKKIPTEDSFKEIDSSKTTEKAEKPSKTTEKAEKPSKTTTNKAEKPKIDISHLKTKWDILVDDEHTEDTTSLDDDGLKEQPAEDAEGSVSADADADAEAEAEADAEAETDNDADPSFDAAQIRMFQKQLAAAKNKLATAEALKNTVEEDAKKKVQEATEAERIAIATKRRVLLETKKAVDAACAAYNALKKKTDSLKLVLSAVSEIHAADSAAASDAGSHCSEEPEQPESTEQPASKWISVANNLGRKATLAKKKAKKHEDVEPVATADPDDPTYWETCLPLDARTEDPILNKELMETYEKMCVERKTHKKPAGKFSTREFGIRKLIEQAEAIGVKIENLKSSTSAHWLFFDHENRPFDETHDHHGWYCFQGEDGIDRPKGWTSVGLHAYKTHATSRLIHIAHPGGVWTHMAIVYDEDGRADRVPCSAAYVRWQMTPPRMRKGPCPQID